MLSDRDIKLAIFVIIERKEANKFAYDDRRPPREGACYLPEGTISQNEKDSDWKSMCETSVPC